MPKPRNPENRGLPLRWKAAHGAYYYNVPPGQESAWEGKKLFRLGRTLPEAYKEWARRLEYVNEANSIEQLLDRYALEIVPTKALKTQCENHRQIAKLRAVFGHMPLSSLQPKDVYKFVDKRDAKVAARREVAVLSHAFTKAVEWGYLSRHPFKGEVRIAGEKPRTRYVNDDELVAILSLSATRLKGSVLAIHAYIRIKLLTGLRRGDLLRLKLSDISDSGITVTTNKTGKKVIYSWSDELKAAIELAKAARPVDISPYLFCNKRGKSYMDDISGDASGWNSMWQRFMERVLAETTVKERFTEHDLRAKCASDADSVEHARALLAHADSRITERVYRRKPEQVKPLR